jgi:hypothetical protein
MKFGFIHKLFRACILIIGFFSCTHPSISKEIHIDDASFKGPVKIKKIEKLGRFCLSINNLRTGGKDRIYTPYEVFSMETGDINGDGRTDICLGIIKPTPFDSILRKRLFIFQIENDYIRPLWLSSRLVHPLEEFRVVKVGSASHVLSIEKEQNNTFCIAEYCWGSFGMHWIKSYGTSLSLTKAKEIISQQ